MSNKAKSKEVAKFVNEVSAPMNYANLRPPLATDNIPVAMQIARQAIHNTNELMEKSKPGENVTEIVHGLRVATDALQIGVKLATLLDLHDEWDDTFDVIIIDTGDLLSRVWITPGHGADWWFVHHQTYTGG